ncbi:MAG: hypothetical protein ACM3H8_04110 [Sphingobacteriales bacterium]
MEESPYQTNLNPKLLTVLIKFNLQALNKENQDELGPQILDLFSQLSSQVKDYESIAPLHKEVLTKIYGKTYYSNKGEARVRRSSKK